MGNFASDELVWCAQRELRQRLFEGSGAIRWRPGRELAAQLLLFLDDEQACWRIAAEWLRDRLDADRVDGGFGGFIGVNGQAWDYLVMAEAQRESLGLPQVLGHCFSAADPGLRAVWGDAEVMQISDVSQERSFTQDLRLYLRELGTAAKLALPVRNGVQPIGLMCADWHRQSPRWKPETCMELGGFSRAALGPVLATAARLARRGLEPVELTQQWAEARPSMTGAVHCSHARASLASAMCTLSAAELKVARLVAKGLSYKEIARELDRSLSTIDHQLRSIRHKLGVSSTARLVSALSDQARPAIS